MTVEPGERFDPLAEMPGHGHRKLTGALAMLLGGEVAGQEVIKYAWDSVVTVLNWSTNFPLEPMPENVAASIFALLAMFAFYQTEEK